LLTGGSGEIVPGGLLAAVGRAAVEFDGERPVSRASSKLETRMNPLSVSNANPITVAVVFPVTISSLFAQASRSGYRRC
jgi:hypothetical protein